MELFLRNETKFIYLAFMDSNGSLDNSPYFLNLVVRLGLDTKNILSNCGLCYKSKTIINVSRGTNYANRYDYIIPNRQNICDELTILCEFRYDTDIAMTSLNVLETKEKIYVSSSSANLIPFFEWLFSSNLFVGNISSISFEAADIIETFRVELSYSLFYEKFPSNYFLTSSKKVNWYYVKDSKSLYLGKLENKLPANNIITCEEKANIELMNRMLKHLDEKLVLTVQDLKNFFDFEELFGIKRVDNLKVFVKKNKDFVEQERFLLTDTYISLFKDRGYILKIENKLKEKLSKSYAKKVLLNKRITTLVLYISDINFSVLDFKLE